MNTTVAVIEFLMAFAVAFPFAMMLRYLPGVQAEQRAMAMLPEGEGQIIKARRARPTAAETRAAVRKSAAMRRVAKRMGRKLIDVQRACAV